MAVRTTLLTILLLSIGIYAAHAIGLGTGDRFGRLGAIAKSKAGGGGGGCTPTGLKFNVACNSQYLTVMH